MVNTTKFLGWIFRLDYGILLVCGKSMGYCKEPIFYSAFITVVSQNIRQNRSRCQVVTLTGGPYAPTDREPIEGK